MAEINKVAAVAFNRITEEYLEQQAFPMENDFQDATTLDAFLTSSLNIEVDEEEVQLKAEAEIRLYQADVTGDSSDLHLGFVSRHLTHLIEEGAHVPADKEAESDFIFPGL